jgi:pimeloyl-ACP methyl ester carboxylesterase
VALIPVRLRRMVLAAGAVAIFPMLAGATYQGVATAVERRQFRHPGQLIDVGGHQLHIHCIGDGSPTVIFEAPAIGMSAAWALVQPAIAEDARACTYDRAGLGWSEAGDRPFDPSAVPDQLHALLEGARERGPYVLVGHGLGAAFATMYAARFGVDVRALVLLDTPSAENATALPNSTRQLVHIAPWLARAGILRATRLLSRNASGLPEPAAGALRAFLNRPDHLTRAALELGRWEETVALAASTPIPPHVQIVQIDGAAPDPLEFLTGPADAEALTAALREVVK